MKQQLIDQKEQLLKNIEHSNYMLNPTNYLNEKNKIQKEKELLNVINYSIEEQENLIIELIKLFLQCFSKMIDKTEQENIIELMYKFRYFMLIPFNLEKSIKNVEQIKNEILEIEQKLVKVAKEKKVIANDVPIEVMRHVFETRIIILEEIYYKISIEEDKKYVQIFDFSIKLIVVVEDSIFLLFSPWATLSCTCSFALKVPLCLKSASTKVVFP